MCGRLRQDAGVALIGALMIVGAFVFLGVATYIYVKDREDESGVASRADATFNLAEAVFNDQLYLLSQGWPGSAGSAYPDACRSTDRAQNPKCPSMRTLVATLGLSDFGKRGASWTVQVRDNGGKASTYSDSKVGSQPAWDQNRDGKLWVRWQASVNKKARSFVTLVTTKYTTETLPRAPVVAGALRVSQDGAQSVIDVGTGTVYLRCVSVKSRSCTNHAGRQINPERVSARYSAGPAADLGTIERLKMTAKAKGTYYTSCPASPSGEIVFVEGPADCKYSGPSVRTVNKSSSPGLFVINDGTVTLGSGIEYFGVVYAVNMSNSKQTLITIRSGATVRGAVYVDGDGRLELGGAGTGLAYDARAVGHVKTAGAVRPMKSTWREYQSALGPV